MEQGRATTLQERILDLVPSAVARDEEEALKKAMAKAARILARRPHAEREIADKLVVAGFPDGTVAAALTRLRELRLVDDEDFARRWIEQRSGKKGRRVLVMELTGKGIDRTVVEDALAELAPDEVSHATDLASRYVRRVAKKPLRQQAASLQTMLVRRGFGYETAAAAVKAVLPPEGWD